MDDLVTATALSEVTRVLDLAGVAANAATSAAMARALGNDLFGLLALGVVAGLGGGMLRDTLLQQGPPVALTDYAYLPTAILAALVAGLVRVDDRVWWTGTLACLDALAVGCWAAAGAERALSAGMSWPAAVMLGTLTVIGGGVIRDVLLQRTPQVFAGGPLYATSAVLAAGTVAVMARLGHTTTGTLVALLVGGGLVLIARWRGWTIPVLAGWSPRMPARRQRRGPG
ncbi:putative membrane protein YeiH [Murinocardiopsis flavida]|uniref:Putative membrane protein YeiH n=1 Tax=Murinocardiopsis flavida TaxID=645275 RepID=A0A2P8DFC5_9ACTN|nr:TRIC cation channel family protein [Murinocardiopsis flavida]PSK95912.1 putative membrane protein YeiH [Murinocardiopsis flavida]